MATIPVEQIVGETLDQHYRITELVRTEPERALFRASEDAGSNAARETLIIVDTSEAPDDHSRRFLEASFLNHPNLVSVSRVGWLESHGHRYPWMATEYPNTLLSDLIKDAPLPYTELIGLVQQIIAGLAYLHSENLAYCALQPDSVWRVGGQWALSDFSQLRVLGSQNPKETRRLLTNRDLAAPPEAYHGEVTASWDVWSLGALLRKTLQPPFSNNKNRSLAPIEHPPLIEAILEDTAAPEPEGRPSLEQISRILATFEPVQPAPVPESQLEPVPVASHSHEPAPIPSLLRDRAELLPRPAGHEPLKRTQGRRILLGILIVAGAFLIALYLGRAVSQRPTPNPKPPSIQEPVQATPPQSQPSAATPIAPTEDTDSVPAISTEIAVVLHDWVAATKSRNTEALVSCYAPVVDTYFSHHHMTASDLVQEKQNALSRIGPIARFEVSNIHYDRVTSDSVVVSFDKLWAFGGAKPFSGSAREQLILRPFGDEWKITSERELKVY